METVQVNGVSFVKAAALAKKHRYTTDYIGQLCRAGKVEAQLVGRAWYVNEESLLGHKSERYSSARSAEISIHTSTVSDLTPQVHSQRREVRPVLSKGAHRSVLEKQQLTSYNFMARGADRISVYHNDEPGSLPTSHHPVLENKALIATPPETKKVKITLTEDAKRHLVFDPLPEVMLRGELRVNSLDSDDFPEFIEPVHAIPKPLAPKSSVTVTKRYQTPSLRAAAREEVSPEPVYESKSAVSAVLSENVPLETVQFRPQIIMAKRQTKNAISFVIVPVSVLVSVGMCLVLFGLTKQITFDGTAGSESIIFNTAAVVETVSKFSQSY